MRSVVGLNTGWRMRFANSVSPSLVASLPTSKRSAVRLRITNSFCSHESLACHGSRFFPRKIRWKNSCRSLSRGGQHRHTNENRRRKIHDQQPLEINGLFVKWPARRSKSPSNTHHDLSKCSCSNPLRWRRRIVQSCATSRCLLSTGRRFSCFR